MVAPLLRHLSTPLNRTRCIALRVAVIGGAVFCVFDGCKADVSTLGPGQLRISDSDILVTDLGIVPGSGASYYPSILIDPQGSPVVAYSQEGPVVSRWQRESWVPLPIPRQLGGTQFPNTPAALAFASRPPHGLVLAYEHFHRDRSTLTVLDFDGRAWEKMLMPCSSTADGEYSESPSVAVAGSEEVALTWLSRRGNQTRIECSLWEGERWRILDGGAAAAVASADACVSSPVLRIADGYPVVAWIEAAGPSRGVHLRWWNRRSSAASAEEVVPGSERAKGRLDMTANSSGRIAVAYEVGDEGCIQVQERSGAFWRILGGDALSACRGRSPRVALWNKYVVICFEERAGDGIALLVWDGNGWEGVDLDGYGDEVTRRHRRARASDPTLCASGGQLAIAWIDTDYGDGTRRVKALILSKLPREG
jgi:hypothetical protein